MIRIIVMAFGRLHTSGFLAIAKIEYSSLSQFPSLPIF